MGYIKRSENEYELSHPFQVLCKVDNLKEALDKLICDIKNEGIDVVYLGYHMTKTNRHRRTTAAYLHVPHEQDAAFVTLKYGTSIY